MNNLKAERTLTAEDRVSGERLAEYASDENPMYNHHEFPLPQIEEIRSMASELQHLRSQSLSTQQPMGEVRDDLRYAFRNADNSDWEHLFAVLPDTGRGKFWKSVFKSAREALHPNQESGE